MVTAVREVANPSAKQVGGLTTSPKLTVLLAVLVVYSCLAGMFIVTSLTSYDDDDHRGVDDLRLPVPLKIVRSNEAVSRQLRDRRKRKLPENYFTLSPPTASGGGDGGDAHWSWPIIHVVSTRFMQGQGNLVNLARSRLKLLEVICLPSLMEQTILDRRGLSEVYVGTKWRGELNRLFHASHSRGKVADPVFLWIIKVDPNLDEGILNELRAILEPVRRFTLVVGSNTNYGIGIKPGGWRGGEAGRDILNAYDGGRVYFPGNDDGGAYHMIRRAHDAREDRVVLETRLDADDAVNVDYFASLQRTALRTLVDRDISSYNDSENEQSRAARWLYWCPRTHIQWNPSSFDSTSDNPGTLQVLQMPYHCITPGLTLGFAVGTREENVPRYTHDKLYWELTINHNISGARNATAQAIESSDRHDCGLYPSSQCAVFVEDPRVSAFRSRALTSAGMNNIETRGAPSLATDDEYEEIAATLWEHTIEDHFGINTKRVKEAADFLVANYLGTIKDNLRGQCSHG